MPTDNCRITLLGTYPPVTVVCVYKSLAKHHWCDLSLVSHHCTLCLQITGKSQLLGLVTYQCAYRSLANPTVVICLYCNSDIQITAESRLLRLVSQHIGLCLQILGKSPLLWPASPFKLLSNQDYCDWDLITLVCSCRSLVNHHCSDLSDHVHRSLMDHITVVYAYKPLVNYHWSLITVVHL